MLNLFLRSILVLALLFGLLFAVGMAVLTYAGAPWWTAAIFALGVVFLQYLLGPWILQLIYKIEWTEPQAVDPELADFVNRICAEKRIPHPRFGLIHDGNPNAFTFGHYPGDARLVVTTGLVERLDSPERQAVVAHELGHIAHWDFVVMTIAAAVPLLLYILYRAMFSAGRRSRKSGSYAAIIGLVSYVVYILSHYIVLLLSRVREYYADQFSGQATGNPDALSTALVKVAYGLAAAPTDKKKDDTRMEAARPFGIFDPRAAQSLALAAGASGGAITAETMEGAMKWGLWNPWAFFYELKSSHPLPAKRIRALEQQTVAQGGVPKFSFRAEQPESYWDEFLVDLFVNYLPAIGLIAGAVIVFISMLGGDSYLVGAGGLALLVWSITGWLKRLFSYRHDFKEARTVHSLIDEVKVSAVRAIPCTIEGQIIGRGIPGLFYSEDLVMQDSTGFIVADYRQPIRLFEFLFGWIKAEKLIGQRGKAMGWYRRSPRPYFELRKLVLEDGQTVTSYLYPFVQFFIYAGMVLGLGLVIWQVLMG